MWVLFLGCDFSRFGPREIKQIKGRLGSWCVPQGWMAGGGGHSVQFHFLHQAKPHPLPSVLCSAPRSTSQGKPPAVQGPGNCCVSTSGRSGFKPKHSLTLQFSKPASWPPKPTPLIPSNPKENQEEKDTDTWTLTRQTRPDTVENSRSRHRCGLGSL